MRRAWRSAALTSLLLASARAGASYVNFESSHVHPIALTPSGARLLAVNTPDALLEVFTIAADGTPVPEAAIPVGLEPVTVVARTDAEAWVVNNLSDTVSVVDLDQRSVVRTLKVGDEPTDVAFAQGKAFVAVSQEDAVKVYDLADLALPPAVVTLFGRTTRALAVSSDRSKVYAVVLRSGNQTTVVNANVIVANNSSLDPARLAALGINDTRCAAPPPAYPPLPTGIDRNPALVDPLDRIPKVALIVRFNRATGRWEDERASPGPQDWSACVPYRLPDHDLFVIDASTLAVRAVDHLGTSLLDVAVNPADGKVWIPHTDARNFVRFEHPLGVRGHVVDNRLATVDPANGDLVTLIDLNGHIDRGSNPAANLAEREASVSQPGMMAFKADGSAAYLTAIGSRKLFVVDPGCAAPGCILGPDRSAPRAVVVGEGPTGVALLESKSRAYVLNRIGNSVAVVDTAALARVAELPLHDPSGDIVRLGRRFLYDAVSSSGHGDAACSSCHPSGDHDGLAWDLGDPTGDYAPYATPNDNVRFIFPVSGVPTQCLPPNPCESHQGIDPQKGPMTTQTLRGMLEPLHWRGDRPTFNEFNSAFVGLLGKQDIGPIAGRPAGLSAADMEAFRQFALGIRFPPNPHRNPDDTLPNRDVRVTGSSFDGNPARGFIVFDTFATDAGQPCKSCHAHPFGAAGGVLGGLTPTEPTSPLAAALFNGNLDLSPHSDIKVAHLRNIYDKRGPDFGPPGGPYPDSISGFGLSHDGAIPDLLHFLSVDVFTLSPANNARDVRDVASFTLHFPTGTRPCVGQQVTVPPGPPPTGTPAEETLLQTLVAIADPTNPDPHGDLVASTLAAGRMRTWLYLGADQWSSDVQAEAPVSTATLRQTASGPVTFLCAPAGEGLRLGSDRDQDGHRNGDDCAPGDPTSWGRPQAVTNLYVTRTGTVAHLVFDPQSSIGPGVRYDVAGGGLNDLRARGIDLATGCVQGGLLAPTFDDVRPGPPAGEGFYYNVRARNGCGAGSFGLGAAVDTLVCP